MSFAIKDNVFVNLIAEQINIIVCNQLSQCLNVCGIPHRTRRIVRCVDYDQPSIVGNGVCHSIPIHAVVRRHQGNVHRYTTLQTNHRIVAVVAGIEHDDFVALMNHRCYGAKQRLGGTGSHSDFIVNRTLQTVEVGYFFCDGLAQRDHTCHGRVLVEAVGQIMLHTL